MKLLPCPFCGSAAVAGFDAPEPRPFYVRCSRARCPGNTGQSYAEGETATAEWQCRAQMPAANPQPVLTLVGFTKKALIRGEGVSLTLDRTGVFQSDEIAFSPWSEPVMKKPRD